MLSIADILIPLFACIGVGVLAGAMRLFGPAEARVLSRFVFVIAFPPAVLDFMRATEPPGPAYLGLIAGYLAAMAATAALALLICRRALGLSVQEAGAAVFACVCGNAVFLGLPIALSVEGWGPPFLILMLFEGLFVFALGTLLMTWPEAGAAPPPGGTAGFAAMAGYRAARNPIFIATLTGLLLAALEVELPSAIGGFLDLFGGIAGPAGLFVLGLYLAILPREQAGLDPKALAALLPVKLLAFPVLAGGLAWAFTGDPTLTAVALLFTALPPAVASVVQSAHYGRYEAGTAALVASGTVVGLGTTTALLVLLLG
jgi:predicted permease